MIPCVSVENMRESAAFTIANLVPSLELMYRAAYGIFQAVSWDGKIAIVVGSGNNGGDGFALACILKEHAVESTVFAVSERLSDDSSFYAEKARKHSVAIKPFTDDCLFGFDIVVDCLLGTGFRGTVKDIYRRAIEAINSSGAYVVSADINSGMNGDTGEAELAVRSDLTVTIGFVKKGLISQNAEKYMKRLVCIDIGIVLLRNEHWISIPGEKTEADSFPCPSWLDWNVLKVYEV